MFDKIGKGGEGGSVKVGGQILNVNVINFSKVDQGGWVVKCCCFFWKPSLRGLWLIGSSDDQTFVSY